MEVLANTVTKGNRLALYNLVAKFAHRDWAAVNLKNGKGTRKNGERINKPYALGYDTVEALGMYTLALQDDLPLEQVGEIKAYIMLQQQYGNIE